MVNFYSERFQLNELHRKIRFQFDCKHFFKCVLVVFSITLLGDIFKMLLTLASDWLREWHEFPGPITGPCKAKPLQSQITFNSQWKVLLQSECVVLLSKEWASICSMESATVWRVKHAEMENRCRSLTNQSHKMHWCSSEDSVLRWQMMKEKVLDQNTDSANRNKLRKNRVSF